MLLARTLKAGKRAAIVALGGLLLLTVPATAQKAGKGNGHGDGQKAAVDANGKLRDLTPAESKELSESMDKTLKTDVESLKATPTKSGAMAIDLNDGFQSAVLAKVDANGAVETKCVNSAAEGKDFFGVDAAAKKHKKAKNHKKPAPAAPKSELETK
jgi:hypothetical protein